MPRSIALLVALNGFKLDAVVSLVIAVLVALALIARNLIKNKVNLGVCFADGIKNAIMALLNVCVIVGFGSVVSATPGYTAIMGALDKIPGPRYSSSLSPSTWQPAWQAPLPLHWASE